MFVFSKIILAVALLLFVVNFSKAEPNCDLKCGNNESCFLCVPCRRTCENYNKSIACILSCEKGCACKNKNYVRNSKDKCVLIKDC